MATDYYGLSDQAIAQLLGGRVKSLRLRRNRTQKWVAEQTGLSERTVIAAEEGRGKLENFIAVLRALRGLDGLDAFLPEPTASPLDLAKRQGRVRQRARGPRQHERPTPPRGEKW